MPDWSDENSGEAAMTGLNLGRITGDYINPGLAAATQVERLFEDLRGKIYAYLAALGAGPADAEDITQEAFIRLYLELRARTEIASATSWLFRVARNLLIDESRSRRSQATVGGADADERLASAADPRIDPEASVLRSERLRRLNVSMNALTSLQMEYLHLRAEGLRYREIAEIYGVAVPSVQDVIRRAVERLGKELQ